QFKAMETLNESGTDFVYDVDIRDYHLWMMEKTPVILVLFDAGARRAYWLAVQRYFREAAARQPKTGAKTVRVRIGKHQTLNGRAVRKIRNPKQQTQGPVMEVLS